MQLDYPFRIWKKDVITWDLSTSVPAERRGPLLVAQLQGTAKTCLQDLLEQAISRGDTRYIAGTPL
eukprot:1284245-Prorocentrum_lima.AAC.1